MKHRRTSANTRDGRSAITAAALAALPASLVAAVREQAAAHGVTRFSAHEMPAAVYRWNVGRDLYADALALTETPEGVVLTSIAGHGDHPSTKGHAYITVIKFS